MDLAQNESPSWVTFISSCPTRSYSTSLLENSPRAGRAGDDRPAPAWLEALDAPAPRRTSHRRKWRGHCGRCRPATSSAATACRVAGPRVGGQARGLRALLRAAALFVTRAILDRRFRSRPPACSDVLDVGCGTGAAGAAWAVRSARVTAIRRHRSPPVGGRRKPTGPTASSGSPAAPTQRDVSRAALSGRHGTAVIVAYTANELADAAAPALLDQLLGAPSCGARAL